MIDPYAHPEPAPASEGTILRLVVGIMAAVLLVVGLVSVAVGKDDKVDPVALLTSAPDAVRAQKAAHVAMTITTKAKGLTADVTMDGDVDFANQRGRFTMSFLRTDLEMISDGTNMFVRVADGGKLPGASKEWVSVPLDAVGAGQAANVDSASSFLDALRGVGATVDDKGVEQVNGVAAHHYRTSFSIEDAIASAPEAQRDQVRQGLEQLQASGDDTFPVDVWMTDDGLPVREVLSMSASLFDVEMQIDFTHFGEKVDVTAPPADQVQRVDDPAQIGSVFGADGSTD